MPGSLFVRRRKIALGQEMAYDEATAQKVRDVGNVGCGVMAK